MDNRIIKLSLIVLAVLIVNTSLVLSLSVSSPYYKNKPLEMYAGQERDILFNLQNCPSLAESCDEENINAVVELEEGGGIAEIISGKNYLIKYGTANTNIKLKVSIPENAAIGEEHLIRMTITSAPQDVSGSMQLGTKYNIEFPVIVKDKSDIPATPVSGGSASKSFAVLIFIIALLTVIILIVIIILYNISRKRGNFK